MDKIITLAGRSDKGVFSFLIDHERQHLEKTASEYHPTIAAYINQAKPIPGRTQILLTALGAGEYWGNNANGDFFPEAALAHEGPDYGYKTFEQHAHIYKNHDNKNPNNSYGHVALSVYNPIFHRVELIVSLDNARAPDLVERHERGECLDVSMGTKVPFDVCSICGNRAPTRLQYCSHAKYYLGKLDPETGRLVYVINTMPRFFDISYVLIGADRIAKTLRKVASHGSLTGGVISSAEVAEKMAAALKSATIEKEVPASDAPGSSQLAGDLARSIMEIKAREEALPRPVMDRLSAFPLPRVLSTMTTLGILPKPQEFQRLVLVSIGRSSLADEMDARNECFDPAEEAPVSDRLNSSELLGAHNFDRSIMQLLLPFMAGRSYVAPHLGPRLASMAKEGSCNQPLPTFLKLGNDGARESQINKNGPILGLTAAMYSMLEKRANAEAVFGIDRLIAENPGLATALGLTLLSVFRHGLAIGGAPKLKGNFTPGEHYENPDVTNVFSRIEQLKQKPYMKVAEARGKREVSPTAKRLYLGMPAAFMASGALQKQRENSPRDNEKRAMAFVRSRPGVMSGLCTADALLSVTEKKAGSSMSKTASPYQRGVLAFAKSMPSGFFNFHKVASAEDFLRDVHDDSFDSQGGVKEALFDQAALETSLKFLSD